MKFLFGLPEVIGVFCGAIVVVIYSAFGGIRSVVFTDVLQFIALAITIPIVLNIGLKWVGGYEGLMLLLPASHVTIYPSNEMFIKYLVVFLYISVPMLTPPFTQRILMSKSLDQARRSFIFMAATDMIFTTIASLIGLVAYVYSPNFAPNGVFLHLVDNLGVGLKGMAVIGILSVIMSTADSYLNTISISFVHDILLPCNVNLSTKQELFWARIVTFIAGILAMLLALYFDNVFELAIYSSNFWGPVIVGPLLLGLFDIKISRKACLISMFFGLSTFFLWEYFKLKDITNIYSIIPSILANIIAAIAAKYLATKLKFTMTYGKFPFKSNL